MIAWLFGITWSQTCGVVEVAPVSDTDTDAAVMVHSDLVTGLEAGACSSVVVFRREQAGCETDEACMRGLLGEYGLDLAIAGTVSVSEGKYFVALRAVGPDDSIWFSREIPPMLTVGVPELLVDELNAANWLKNPEPEPEAVAVADIEDVVIPVQRDEPEAEASNTIVRVMGGVSTWQLPGAEGGLEIGLHLSRAVTLELEGGAIYGRKSATHTAEIHDVLLIPAAVGVGIDPPSSKRVRPSLAVLGTATLYSLQPRVSPGLKVRPAIDFTTASGFGWTVEGFGGMNIAPGIDVAIDPDFAEIAPVFGARMGFVVRT